MLQWWRFPAVAVACLAMAIVLYLAGGWVHRPPDPPAAMLPASARVRFPPPHKENIELKVAAHQELDFRVGMQAGATLVYAWSTGRRSDLLAGKFPDQSVGETANGHGALEAQSSGWYHWRWSNPSGDSVMIHFTLTGYYELEPMPSDMPGR